MGKPRTPKPEGHTEMGHRIELDPTGPQLLLMRQWCGVSRVCYNEALAWRDQVYRDSGKGPKEHEVRAHLRDIRDQEKPWIGDAPKEVLEGASRDLETAYQNWWKGINGKGARQRHPTFKRRGENDAYYVRNENLRFDGLRVKLPKLGWVRMKEKMRLSGRVLSARIKVTATGRVFLSLQVVGPHQKDWAEREEDRAAKLAEKGIRITRAPRIGLDIGVKREVVTSCGEVIDAPRPLKRLGKALARAQRTRARRQPGSKNRNKARLREAKIHERVRNIREDHLNKITTRICRENQAIVIEDLNIKGMKQLRSLAPSLQDIAPARLLGKLAYKAPLFGCLVIKANRWFPSSKRCSGCGAVKETLLLSERTYRCDACGMQLDRDANAALNLYQYPDLPSYPLAGGESTPGERVALQDRASDSATNLAEPGRNDS